MYLIYTGSTVLHDPETDKLAIEAKLTEEINTQGSLNATFTAAPTLGLRSPVGVYDDDGLIWRGRVLSIENGLDERRIVHFEGALSYLCDTIIQPFAFRGQPDGATGLFAQFIAQHNAQLPSGDIRRFTLGAVTVTDPNDYIYRASETAMSTWDAIKSKLIDTLGGYIYLSGKYLNVINYVADFSEESGQQIKFGENLLEYAQTDDADGIVTMLYAYGAQFDEDDPSHEVEPDQSGFHTWHGNRVHLSAPVEYSAGTAKWGKIYGTETWDDITLTTNLQTAAQNWLAKNYYEHVESIEVNAVDLSLLDANIDKISVGRYVNVICQPLDIDTRMLCTRKETDLIHVSQTNVSIGKPPMTISTLIGGPQKYERNKINRN